MMKRTIVKRLLCGFLGVLMFLSITGGQFSQIAAQSRTPTLLSAERLSDLPEGNVVYFGTASVTLVEANSYYAVPIYREGDLSQSAFVQVRAFDMTALYGKDYELYMSGVKAGSSGETILQSYLQGAAESSGVTEVEPERSEAETPETSPLAQLKQEATGQPTRNTYETAANDIITSIVESIMPETMEQVPYAASLDVEFAPGEDEKWITFRLMDDKQSEGTENFTLALANAQGAEAYSVTTFSVTINDDEPTVHSVVSFTEARYDSSKGIATITVERTGAEYSLVDMRIFTSEDTAKADINYVSMDTVLTFAPYETKQDVEFYVGGEGSFTVLLDNFTACQPGRYTRTKVYISPEDSAAMVMADNSNVSTFSITLPQASGSKQFTVEYIPGQPTGKIMDYSYDPVLEVGCYYFSLPAEKGGIFYYDSSQFAGTNPRGLGTLTCEYVTAANQHTSYGSLKYYHSTVWKSGKVWTYSKVTLPGVYYQYVAADWEATEDFGKKQRYRLNSTTLGMKKEITVDDGFGRTQSNAALKLLNLKNTNYNKRFHISVDAHDYSENHTPKCYLRFYGAAAMYKSYKISVNEPNQQTYLTGTGGTVSNVPVQVSVRCGAQDPLVGGSGGSRFIFANTDTKQTNLVFSLDTSNINGAEDKFGVLTGYTIAIDPGAAGDRVEVNYPQHFIDYLNKTKGTTGKISNYSASAVESEIKRILANLDTIPYDSYFIDWIDSVQKNVVNAGHGYYQNLVFTPQFEYVDVTVEVRSPDIVGATGAFADATLSKPGVYTYHAGDVLDLSAVCNTAGYRVVGYEYSVDGDITSDIVSSTDKLLLLPKYSHYIIRPVLAENNNCIEIVYSGDSANILGVDSQGVITQEEGSTKRYFLNLNPQASTTKQKTAPEVGQIYSICFKTYTIDDTLYVPVITDATGKVYTTQQLDFVASQRAINNVLKLSYVARSSQQSYTLTGNLVSDFPTILSSGLATKRLGVGNFLVSLPIKQKEDNGITRIESTSDRTTNSGKFILSGVSGQCGDRMTMLVTNGASTSVVEVILGSSAQQNIGELVMTYPADAPYVTSLQYQYGKSINNASVDNSNNSVRIMDDTLLITIVVNTMGHDVSHANFTAYILDEFGKEITSKPYKAISQPDNPGVFTVEIPKMAENLYNGHRIRVSLVEKDPDGEHAELPAVDTGLVFYVENVLVVPQTYDTSSTPTVNIPMLGAANASAGSGLLSFSRVNWGGGTGYTLTVNVDAVANTTSLSTSDKLAKYNTLSKSAETAYYAKKDAAAIAGELENSASYLFAKLTSEETDEDKLKESIRTIGRQIDKAEETLDSLKEQGEQAKNAVAGYSDVHTLKVDVLFLLSFDFVYSPERNEYVFCSGCVSIGGSVNYSKTVYFVVYGFPLYLNITGFLQGDLTVYYPNTSMDPITAAQFESYSGNLAERMSEVDAEMTILLNLKASVGVGMCNVIGGGGALSFKMQFSIPFTSDDYGVLLSATGSIYVDLLVGRINVDLGSVHVGMGKYEDKSGFDYIGENLILSPEQQTLAENTSGLQNYGAGTDDLSVFGYNDMIRATPQEVQRTVLLSEAAERTAPQIVELDDGRKMVFFIGNRGTGDSLSSRALFWSVWENGRWSVPQIVADDGTFDASPTVVQENGEVVVAWVDADGTASGQSSNIEKLNSLGISAAVFKDGEMGPEIHLVEDEFFNCAPQLNLDGDTLYCSYMKRDISAVTTDEGLLDMTGTYSTMAYVSYHIPSKTAQDEQFIVIAHPTLTDPLVTDYQCVTTIMGGESYMLATYTVDEDGNLNSAEDRELFLSITNLTTGTTYYPIQLTSDQSNQALPKLSKPDGTVYLCWMENGSVFHLLNVSELLEAFFYTDEVGDVYRSSTGLGWHRKTAADLPGLTSVSYEGSYYDLASRDRFYDHAVDLHPDEKSSISISDYILTTNGDDLYLFFTDFGSNDPNDLSMELYGLQYQRDMSDDGVEENWGFGLPVQITDYGKVIDEFDLYMTEDNKISMVSNHYRQWIDSNGITQQGSNELIQIEFDTKSSLSILGELELPSRLVGGETGAVTLQVYNDGLMDANGFDVTMVQISGETEQTVYSESFDTCLGSGESCDISLPWVIPQDVSDTRIKVVVTEHHVAISKPAEAVAEVSYRSMLKFTDLTVARENDACYISATVTNLGNADAPAAAVQAGIASGTKLSKLYAETALPALASGESIQIKLPFMPALEDFSQVGIIDLVLQAVSGEDVLTAGYTKLASSQPMVVQINEGAECMTLGTDASTTLTTKVAPWNQIAGDVQYTSSAATVAYVDSDGNVHGVSEGTATITAYYPAFGISDTIEIIVTQDPHVPETGDINTYLLWLPPMLLSSAAAILLIWKKRTIQ